jgi:hypothetical protein
VIVVRDGISRSAVKLLVGQPSSIPAAPPLPKRVRRTRAALPVPPPFAPRKPVDKTSRRWYQYSLRSLLVLMLLVSLLMSWFAVKRKRAIAQKKAVEAILEAEGTVEYDFQFDSNGAYVKGASGQGPEWLRDLTGPDYFDTAAYASVKNRKGIEAVNEFPHLRSLEVTECGAGDVGGDLLNGLRPIDGLEELKVDSLVSDMKRLPTLLHVKRLELTYDEQYFQDEQGAWQDAPLTLPPPAAFPALRELYIDRCNIGDDGPDGIGAFVTIEKLSLRGNFVHFDLRKLVSLANLRDLEIAKSDIIVGPDPNPLTIKGVEQLRGFRRLERLAFGCVTLQSADLRHLCDLSELRQLDLSNCPSIDDSAVPYLKKMKHLTFLKLEGTNITDAAAESIDDALPDCEVRY